MAKRLLNLLAVVILFNNLSPYWVLTLQSPKNDTCSFLREKFSNATSNFIMCSIDKSKPITFCEDCVDEYLDTLESYQNMSRVQVNGTNCIDNFVNLDRLEIVDKQNLNNINLWNEAKCSECFVTTDNGTQTKDLSVIAKTFQAFYSQYESCKNSTDLEQICRNCMEHYINLDTYYRSMSNTNEKIGTCMDLVDKMNTSWTFWGAHCCKFRKHNEYGFIIATVSVLVVTILFYILAQFCTKHETASIVQQTRFPAFLSSLSTSINNHR